MKKFDWRVFLGRVLFITLIFSIFYSIVRIIQTPADLVKVDESMKVRTDYILMLIQCLLGLFVMQLPSIAHREFSIKVPDLVEILYYTFLFCAIYLGEVRSFYYLVPFWDSVLHAFSCAMLGSLGFSLVNILNREFTDQVKLSPFFVALFAFCFAIALGSLWEIYEFSMDNIFLTNMQKYMTYHGEVLVGRFALADTMKDLIIDSLSALVVSTIGYFNIRRGVPME